MRYIQERNVDELNVFKSGYLPLTYWKNWFRNIRQFFSNIKYAWQRATKGFCDRDTWNLDSYYLQLLYHTLKYLAKNTNSYPGRDEFSDEQGGFDAWQQYLSNIADCFENAEEWNESIPINQQIERACENMNQYLISTEFVPCEDGSNCSKLKYNYSDEQAYNKATDEWLKTEKEAYAYRQAEVNKGFDMLKKYFFDLWD